MATNDLIDKYVDGLNDWRGEMVRDLRKLIHEVDGSVQEDWKWNTPVFAHNGNVCALGVFKEHVKLNFFKGVSLADPDKLINSGFDSKSSRAIDFKKGDRWDVKKLRELIKEAIALNK